MSSNTPFHVVIPARYASSRLPAKPLLDIGGKPMIRHVWERAQESGAATVVIATDDSRIVTCAQGFGAEVALTSPDHRSGSDRIAEVARQRGWSDESIVVNVQGDEPFLPPALIRQVAEAMASHPRAGVATLSAPIEARATLFDPNVVKVVRDREGFAHYFSRAPIPWHRDGFAHGLALEGPLPEGNWLRHIGLYAYRAGFLQQYVAWPPAPTEIAESLEQLRVLWHGGAIHVGIACEPPGHGVDTPEDLERARAEFERR